MAGLSGCFKDVVPLMMKVIGSLFSINTTCTTISLSVSMHSDDLDTDQDLLIIKYVSVCIEQIGLSTVCRSPWQEMKAIFRMM